MHAPLNERIRLDSVPFAINSPEGFNVAVDKMIGSLSESLHLLGFGEALHGGEEILVLRNRLFERLVTAHGFSAIAIESSFPRARLVNEYVSGRGPGSYDEVKENGFGHGFGQLEANRELVEWMRTYNAESSPPIKLRFYGFDIPSGSMGGIASPRQVLEFVLDFLSGIDKATGQEFRQRIDSVLAEDAQWENPAAYVEPGKSIALSPEAAAVRIATEDLITELRTQASELAAKSSPDEFWEALHYARVARDLLNFHVALASRKPGESPARVLAVRDVSMAENLAFITARERGRGKVLVFAHNNHLQRGKTVWPGQKYWGSDDPCEWWPAGSHLDHMLGACYAVIGSAIGVSDDNGIGSPELGTLESRLTAARSPALFIPTHKGRGLPAAEIEALPTRSTSAKNPTYAPLRRQSFTDFDWFAFISSATYNRGGPLLRQPGVSAKQ